MQEKLVHSNPDNVDYRYHLGGTLINLSTLLARQGQVEEAMLLLRQAIEHEKVAFDKAPQSPNFRRGLNNAYGALAEVERKLGKPSESSALLLERRKLWPGNPQELYRIARELAETAVLVEERKAELAADERAARPLYEAQAVETLRQAVACGFRDLERVQKQQEFAALRQRQDFKQALAEMQK